MQLTPRALAAAALVALPLAGSAEAQVQNPANGNWYQAVSAPQIRWDDARTAAEAMTFGGSQGHLVTLADAAENDWVWTTFSSPQRHWVGGFQDLAAPGYSEPGGGWGWTTGETFGFTSWNPGEPNDFGGIEHYLAFDNTPNWNDAPIDWAFSDGYIVEFEGGGGIYCTAKVNSLGCTPSIGTSGGASASSASAFDIHCDQVINNKVGILFYGFGQNSIPFQGGLLCVTPPIKRTAVQASGGNPPPNDCSGTFSLDFNALIQGGSDPNLIPGAMPAAQYWYRDPASPSTTGLSDAVEFTISA